MASVEPFDTYEALPAPDFTDSFDRNAKRMLEGREDQSAALKQNAEARVANAKLGWSAFTKAQQISPTLAKATKIGYDKKENRHKNIAVQLSNDTGINQASYAAYKEENGKSSDFTGYINSLAYEQERIGTNESLDYAKQLRSLHGRDLYHVKQNLALNHALNTKLNFQTFLQSDAARQVADPENEGQFLEWSSTDNAGRELIFREFEVSSGFDLVNELNSDFLNDKYFPTYNAEKGKILRSAGLKQFQEEETNKAYETVNKFVLAASTVNPDGQSNLVQTFIETVEETRGRFIGNDGQPSRVLARKHWIDTLDQMLTDEVITAEQYESFINAEIKDRSSGKMVAIKNLWSNEFGNVDERIQKAIAKKQEDNDREDLNTRNEAGNKAVAAFEEREAPPSEQEIAQLIRAWKTDPKTSHLEVPTQYTSLLNSTQEDLRDADIEEILKGNYYNGKPIGDLWKRMQPGEARTKWQGIAENDGESTSQRSIATGEIGRLVDLAIGNTSGVAGRSNEAFGTIYMNSLDMYRGKFREVLALTNDAAEAQRAGLELVTNQLNQPNTLENKNVLFQPRTSSFNTDFVKKQNAIIKTISTRSKNGQPIFQGERIDGLDLDALEMFQTKKQIQEIPSNFHWLASTLKVPNGQGGILDGWGLANAYYQSITGKELRKPSLVEALHKKSVTVQQLLNPKGLTINRKNRARVIDQNGGDFSTNLLNPLLV